MRSTRFPSVIFIGLTLKFFAWCVIVIAAIFFLIGLYAVYRTPVSMWTWGLFAVFAYTFQCLAAATFLFWFAYILLLLNNMSLHSRRHTFFLRRLAGSPLPSPSAQIPDLAPDIIPDLAPTPSRSPASMPDTTLPRGYRITGLDKNHLMFVLTYEWITRQDAIAKATADGLIEILDVQLLKN